MLLTHCGQVMPYGDIDQGYIDLSNGLLPEGLWGHKAITWTNVN